MGNQEHVFWKCGEVVKEIKRRGGNGRPRRPKDGWQERFGWPDVKEQRTEKGRRYNKEVLQWLEAVVTLIWDRRYGNEEKKRRKETAIKRRTDELVRRQRREGDEEWWQEMKRD